MTSKITVTACCDPDTTQLVVEIYRGDSSEAEDRTVLQDGEDSEFSVYDDIRILTFEGQKENLTEEIENDSTE